MDNTINNGADNNINNNIMSNITTSDELAGLPRSESLSTARNDSVASATIGKQNVGWAFLPNKKLA